MSETTGTIAPEEAGSIPGLFRERVARTPDKPAYRDYDIGSQSWVTTTWAQMANEVARWQAALRKENLKPGDRVAVMLRNSREWVVFDQAALGLGLVNVPLYLEDRPDNAAYIINHAEAKLLLVEGRRQWQRLEEVAEDLSGLQRIVSVNTIEEDDQPHDPRLVSLNDWIFGCGGELVVEAIDPDALATIVYTSGTTGRPKGVMLSHRNILFDAHSSSTCGQLNGDDVFLSFLPLSHTLERTGGYYLPMLVGAEVAYARSIPQLGEDLVTVKPTVLISVPRIYERVYGKIMDGLKEKSGVARWLFRQAQTVGWRRFEYSQGRAGWSPLLPTWPLFEKLVASKVHEKLGGRLRLAICGGAALSPPVARLFIGLGVTVLQGYGMTESSPVVSVNRPDDNIPESIGTAIPGVEVKIGPNDELLTRSPAVMLGYWKNDEATRETVDDEGWLHTGDKASMDEQGHIFITGRLKEIIVMANGEKVPPADMEMAIAIDGLFEQVMVIGEAKPFLTALVVLNQEKWEAYAREDLDVDPHDPAVLQDSFVQKSLINRMAHQLREFPGYAQVRRITPLLEPWTVEDGLITPTMKMKRARIAKQYADDIEAMYAGHSL
ncbi:MAG: long-chain fatty acid--CoA ligase [Gammaproteobacteria bacterium]|nr:long-chain fatty acid--CoA ligase [Gammaproteobacteria bacterium]MDX5375041.1 long-chain fatty acid--CoA ligase [Gammaproteobacteria bacterium]